MTYEEMQKTMQFILEQQAQLTANQQRADERMDRADERAARADKRLDRAEKLIARTARTVDGLATYAVERFGRTDTRISAESEDVNAKLAALVDAQIRTEETLSAKINALIESQARTEEAVRRLSERGEKTDEAVRKLTDFVNDHLRNHRNGEQDVGRE